jgi:RNA polymerase sigma-70 factor (ECF subfamily)
MSSPLPSPTCVVVAAMAAHGGSAAASARAVKPPDATPPVEDRDAADERLVQRVARGDQRAFGQLYDRLAAPLYGTAVRIVHDTSEAQDIVHDAFVTMWEKSASFDAARGTAFSWAVTLVRNRAIDRVRTRRRRTDLLAAAAPGDLGYSDAAAGPPEPDPAQLNDRARAVRAAIADLPAEQQTALELAFFGGLTQEEIAGKLSAPLGTVKARIRRGLLKLRDGLVRRL